MTDLVKAYIRQAYRRVEDITPKPALLPTVQVAPDVTPAQKYIALRYKQPKREEIAALDGDG